MLSFRKKNLDKIKSFIRNSEEIKIDKLDKEKLIGMIRPTIGIKTKATDDEKLKIGKSKIGGKPDLPKDFEWPIENGKPMLFCAQYNLSELTEFDKENSLPKKGFFYIFLSLDEKYNEFNGINQPYKFIFSESEQITRIEFPRELIENHTFRTAKIEYFEFYTIPSIDSYKLFELDERYEDLGYNFNEITEDYIRELLKLDYDNYHQILGQDRSIQSSFIYELSSKELNLNTTQILEYKKEQKIIELAKRYELLLQLDCNDSNSDLNKFGGSGTYYFGISRNNLIEKKFNNIKMTFQL